MVERANYKFPPIPGVYGEVIREKDMPFVKKEVERLASDEKSDNMSKIARIFDASPDSIQDEIRIILKGTFYETH